MLHTARTLSVQDGNMNTFQSWIARYASTSPYRQSGSSDPRFLCGPARSFIKPDVETRNVTPTQSLTISTQSYIVRDWSPHACL